VTVTEVFPPDSAAVRDVRRFVAAALPDVADEPLDVVVLATSELAANCVRHAGTEFTVTVDRTGDSVRVTMEDAGTGDPVVHHPDPRTPSGRGLLIVEQLADSWGSRRVEGRNRVWFSMKVAG
jgi:anti-sigma regulatory factor (Ser/Thr protein kinase)